MTDPGIVKRRKGRAPGVPNRFSGDMKWAVLETFRQLGGLVWLKAQAQEHPVEFMHLLGKLLPKQVSVDTPPEGTLAQLLEQVHNAKVTRADLEARRALS